MEGVAILLNYVWHSAVVDFDVSALESSGLNSRFQGLNEGDNEEMDRFWNDMDSTLDRVGNRYRLCILDDVKGWIGDRKRAGIIGAFGVPGENDNGRRVVEFCAERELCVGNT